MLFRAMSTAIVTVALASCAAGQIPPGISRSTTSLDALKGQTFIIRGFFDGDRLRYDTRGKLVLGGRPQSWTVAEVEIIRADVKGNRLVITGTREAVSFDDKKPRLVDRMITKKNKQDVEKVVIEADLPRADEAAALDAARQIFLTEDDRLADLVPEYWKGIVGPPDVVLETPANAMEQLPAAKREPNPKAYRVGAGVTAPRAIVMPDPKYAETARQSRYEGTVVLWAIVGQEGKIEAVRIQRPLGMGLDEEAVKAVREWKFQPATKDGQPVPVQINIEVNFRLY